MFKISGQSFSTINSTNKVYFIPLDKSFAKEEKKKKVKVPDYHFHSDSSLKSSAIINSLNFIHCISFISSPWISHCEGGRGEERESD